LNLIPVSPTGRKQMIAFKQPVALTWILSL